LLALTAPGQSVVRGEPDALKIPLKTRSAEVFTVLLGAPAANGAPTGRHIKISAVAQPSPTIASSELVLTPPGGPSATAALQLVGHHIQVRHKGWPVGFRIGLNVTGDVSKDDLESGSFAMALALDSMFAGWTPDPKCTVLGALASDGELGPVTSAIPRVLAAVRAGAARVVMPEKMFKHVTDILVSEGPTAFAHTQIFTVTSLQEAPAIASVQQDPQIVRAFHLFEKVEEALRAGGADADATLKTPAVKDALREVLTVAPSHMTARLLLGRTTGQYTTLSLDGSLLALEAMSGTLLKAARSRTPGDMALLPANFVTAEIARLKASRNRLDAKVQPIIDAVLTYGEVARAWNERPTEAAQGLERNRMLLSTAKAINDEWSRVVPRS
jgi:hypothetical protein